MHAYPIVMKFQKFEDIIAWQKAQDLAVSSSSEVRSMLYLAGRLGYIDQSQRDNLLEKSAEISRIIRGLIKSLK
mgnify:CR=1 FL=1